MKLRQIKDKLQSLKNPEKEKLYLKFFKTGKGEYGEGDRFLGLTMPEIRSIAKDFKDLSLIDIKNLLQTKIHEYRMSALIILTYQYPKAEEKKKEEIYQFYLANTKWINNWDLVDLSAHKIVGAYLLDKPSKKKILYKLAKSKNLWERRISIISTFAFIHESDFTDALKIAEVLVDDKHDLIHKAVGWVLREVGKKDQSLEERFLKRHYKTMPRIMLRYAIEKFDQKKRLFYLGKK